MLLRTRITLMASICFVALAAIVIAESRLSESKHLERYETALMTGTHNTWLGIVESALRRLEVFVPQIAGNAPAVSALADQDPAEVGLALTSLAAAVKVEVVPSFVEVVVPTGELMFASITGGPEPEVLRIDLVIEAVRAGVPLRGLVRSRSGKFAVMVAVPVFSRAGAAGVIGVYSYIDSLLADLAASTSTNVFVVEPDQGLTHGEAGPVWEGVSSIVTPALVGQDGVSLVEQGGRMLSVAYLTLSDAFIPPTALLLSVKDITESYRRDQIIDALSLGTIVAGLALFLSFLFWYMRTSFRPLNIVIRVLNALSSGNTSVSVPEATSDDEIGRLAGTVEAFRQAQKDRDQLATIRQELDAAQHIQQAILTSDFPVRGAYSLRATMRAARDVGGDFYDFFELDDDHIGFVIADVSDKGMAAALFMAVARTVIRTTAMIVPSPGVCLERANTYLSSENSGSMFVTAFYGVLDPSTGEVVYANAGHNSPFVVDADGSVRALETTGGTALGVLADLRYVEKRVTLAPGERLFLYTDGITEAFSQDGEEYGDRRLRTTLEQADSDDPAGLIGEVLDSVDLFAAGEPQADDITCLVIAYHGTAQPADGALPGVADVKATPKTVGAEGS